MAASLPEGGADAGRALARRFRSPVHGAAFAFIYGLYLVILLPSMGRSPVDRFMLIQTAALGMALFVWVAPFPWQWRTRPVGWGLARGALQAMVFMEAAFIGAILAEGWFSKALGSSMIVDLKGEVLHNALFGAPISMVVGGVMASYEWARDAKDRAREALVQAQTRLLQSQLHPHVLFNALNGLAELVHKDPVRARTTTLELSELMDRLLGASASGTLPLAEERKLAARYLAIEAMRLGSRLRVRWEWDPDVDALEAPPLLLQPVVENAVKHGISPSPEGGEVVVCARIGAGSLVLEVRNTGMPPAPVPTGEGRPGEGIGVRNLVHRLELAYGPGPWLTLERVGAWTVVRMALPAGEPRFPRRVP